MHVLRAQFGGVRRLIAVILMMTASAVLATSVIHAREWQPTASIDCSGIIDADHHDGKASKGVPSQQHGSCQAPAVDPHPNCATISPIERAKAPFHPPVDRSIDASAQSPTLRPPKVSIA